MEITGDAAFDGVRRTYHQRQEALSFEYAPPDEMEKLKKRLAALKGDADPLIREGLAKRVIYDIGSAFDGVRYCNRLTGSPATYKSIDRCTDFIVDPRTWGLTTTYSCNDDLASFFPPNAPARLRGRDKVGDHDVWKVEVDKEKMSCCFWIADREPFRVYRYEMRFKQNRWTTTIASEFIGAPDDCPLPTRVTVEHRDAEDKLTSTLGLTVSNLAINVPVDPNVGTIESLNLPASVPVQDRLAHKTIGVWDGK
ncbi:MAG: hypothetical protein U0746_21555, partial [Gemmataceae bacterium]